MIETCCQLGVHRQLAAISTEPGTEARHLAVVMVSAGLVPKFGPYRLYAELARRLAAAGLRSLRFDLGDVGDSRPAHPGQALVERTRREIATAVDHLEQRFDLDGVILSGLCSGAEDSFRYAENDPRVRAVVLIDPFSYRTPGWHWRNALQRLTRRTLRLLGLYEPLEYRHAATPKGASVGASRLTYQGMEFAEAGRILKTLIARNVQLHFIYTGGSSESFNHVGQLQAMFRGVDFRGQVTVDLLPHIDHTQPLQAERDDLIEIIARRLEPLGRRVARAPVAADDGTFARA